MGTAHPCSCAGQAAEPSSSGDRRYTAGPWIGALPPVSGNLYSIFKADPLTPQTDLRPIITPKGHSTQGPEPGFQKGLAPGQQTDSFSGAKGRRRPGACGPGPYIAMVHPPCTDAPMIRIRRSIAAWMLRMAVRRPFIASTSAGLHRCNRTITRTSPFLNPASASARELVLSPP